jgi:hypothetical protein
VSTLIGWKGCGGTGRFPDVFKKKGARLIIRKTGIRSREFRSQKDIGKHGFPREREPKASDDE